MNRRDARMFEIDGALNESAPITDDPEVWAQWYDRKANAGQHLRDLSEQAGDDQGVATADDLIEKSRWAARQLRRNQS